MAIFNKELDLMIDKDVVGKGSARKSQADIDREAGERSAKILEAARIAGEIQAAREKDAKAKATIEAAKPRTIESVTAELENAFKVKDLKAVSRLAAELTKLNAIKEAGERDAKVKALVAVELKVKSAIMKAVQTFIDDKSLDVADGVWFSYDFGDKSETIRLMKGSPKAKGTGTGKGSYVACAEKTADLLIKVGDQVMFKEATVVTIDKVEQTMQAGMTLKQAYDFSSNGGWRNRVVMAVRRAAGVI
jgi:hypothetical protein